MEVSFLLNLFRDGFSIGKASEVSILINESLLSIHYMMIPLLYMQFVHLTAVMILNPIFPLQVINDVPNQLYPYDRSSEALFNVSLFL